MRWNDDCTLISLGEAVLDGLLQATHPEEKVEVSCRKRDLTRSEFYFASQTDMKPSMVLEVHTFEYDGQVFVDYNGQRYKVIKTFEVDQHITELTCERVVSWA